MRLISPSNYSGIQRLVKSLDYHLVLTSILQGNTNANVYVDDSNRPRTAFLWSKGKAWLLGEPIDNITESLINVINQYEDYLRKNGGDVFRLHYSQVWATHIPDIFSGLRLEKYTRSYYSLESQQKDWSLNPPEGYRILPVDDALLTSDYENIDLVKDEMRSECSSVQEFLNKHISYVAIIEGTIVSWCMSEYTTASSCELGIATIEKYQRKGLATQVAKGVINLALKNNINNIGWHCWKKNIPSVKTALTLGFEYRLDYPVQEVWLNTS